MRKRYIYGPVPSRRLGRSLGVDLVPKKTCTYDCIYCQIGRTTQQTVARQEYIPAAEIIKDVAEALNEWGDKIDYIAISGSGEPCLNTAIGEVIEGIKKLTATPVALITNSSLFPLEEVRQAVMKADLICPSLDATTPHVFQTINRPHPSLSIPSIIEGLSHLRQQYKGKIWLEILLCRGINDAAPEIEALREAIRLVAPDRVQLNTVVRPGTEDYAAPLPPRRLEEIRVALGGIAEVIAGFSAHQHPIAADDLDEQVIDIISRRPETPDGLAKALGIHDLEVAKILDRLTKEGKAIYRVFNNRLYYEAKRS